MTALILALLRFLSELFKTHSETPTTATEIPANRDDHDRFSKWVRDRTKTGDSGGEPERVPPR